MDTSREIHFAGWTLDRAAGELSRDATRVRLQRQSLLLLEALLARPGELVSRETLIKQLWPKGVVDYDTALNTAVRRLRAALQDDADHPKYVETIPRRGYRLIPPIEAAPSVVAASVAATAPETVRAGGARTARALVAAMALVSCTAIGLAWLRTADEPRDNPVATRMLNPEARELTERARHLMQRREPGDVALASKYFLEAITIDPQHAQAWAGLSSAYWLRLVTGEVPPEQGLARLRDAAERALGIDPELAEPHIRLAHYRWALGDHAERDAHLRRALELDPRNHLVLGTLATDALQAGQFDLAIELQRRALAADPLSVIVRFNLASVLYLAGRYDEATETLMALQELNPATTLARELLGTLLVIQGRHEEALLSVQAGNDEERLFVSALAYHGLGRFEDSAQAAAELAAQLGNSDPLRLAELWAHLGRPDEAFEQLERASAAQALPPWQQGSQIRLWMMPYSALLRPLHADPRWDDWLASR